MAAAAILCVIFSGLAIYNASPSLPFTFPAWMIPALRRYAWSLLRDGSEADDLVQDSLVRALDRILSRISLVCESNPASGTAYTASE